MDVSIYNPPEQETLSYRAGTHGVFLERMLQQLRKQIIVTEKGEKSRPLAQFRTQDLDDPIIALLDAWAMSLDVLTFYQERVANEGYLRTATEYRSIKALVQAVGYDLSLGNAASTYLTFRVDDAKDKLKQITIPAGTKVTGVTKAQEAQSVTFETTKSMIAHLDWNEIKLLVDQIEPEEQAEGQEITSEHPTQDEIDELNKILIRYGMIVVIVLQTEEITQYSVSLSVQAPSTKITTGSVLLFVDTDDTDADVNLEPQPLRWWYSAMLDKVTEDDDNHWTLAHWNTQILPLSFKAPYIYCFKQRGFLFGHGAPNWPALSSIVKLQHIIGSQIFAVVRFQGDVLAAGASGKIYQYNSDTEEWPEKKQQLPSSAMPPITAMVTYAKKLVVATADSVYQSEDNKAFILLDQASKFSDIRGIAFDTEGELFVNTEHGIFQWMGGKEWEEVEAEDAPIQALFYVDPLGFDKLLSGTVGSKWPSPQIPENVIDLDGEYNDIISNSWVLLTQQDENDTDLEPEEALIKIQQVSTVFREDFGLSARVTRITLDPEYPLPPDTFTPQATCIYMISEQMAPISRAPAPSLHADADLNFQSYRITDEVLDSFEQAIEDDEETTPEQQQMAIFQAAQHKNHLFRDKNEFELTLKPIFTDHPEWGAWLLQEAKQGVIRFNLAEEIENLNVGQLICIGGKTSNHPTIHEMATIYAIEVTKATKEPEEPEEEEATSDQMTVVLKEPIQHDYHLNTLFMKANVIEATHGESVQKEVLGSGVATLGNQRFTLSRSPLTYIEGKNTLEVRVNEVLWQEVSSLHEQDSVSRSYVVQTDDDGQTTVIFGDGNHGARLPSGYENVVANYRVGIGADANIPSGTLNSLLDSITGIKSVENPIPATGGQSPESHEAIRHNLPAKVAPHDRLVSIKDYEHFAETFPGIARAKASKLWNRDNVVIHITIAGAKGAVIEPYSNTYINLLQAIDQHTHLNHQMTVELRSYRPLN